MNVYLWTMIFWITLDIILGNHIHVYYGRDEIETEKDEFRTCKRNTQRV